MFYFCAWTYPIFIKNQEIDMHVVHILILHLFLFIKNLKHVKFSIDPYKHFPLKHQTEHYTKESWKKSHHFMSNTSYCHRVIQQAQFANVGYRRFCPVHHTTTLTYKHFCSYCTDFVSNIKTELSKVSFVV